MKLDGKFSYVERAMSKIGVKLFQYITKDDLKNIASVEKNKVIVEPVDFDKYQVIDGFMCELSTVPKMCGKVIKSTIDNLKEGDTVLYANNYSQFRYFIDVSDKSKMYFQIDKDDIIMKK